MTGFPVMLIYVVIQLSCILSPTSYSTGHLDIGETLERIWSMALGIKAGVTFESWVLAVVLLFYPYFIALMLRMLKRVLISLID